MRQILIPLIAGSALLLAGCSTLRGAAIGGAVGAGAAAATGNDVGKGAAVGGAAGAVVGTVADHDDDDHDRGRR